jgi:hypothetical protein
MLPLAFRKLGSEKLIERFLLVMVYRMDRLRRKKPRLKLGPKTYNELCGHVLARDGWRCQS